MWGQPGVSPSVSSFLPAVPTLGSPPRGAPIVQSVAPSWDLGSPGVEAGPRGGRWCGCQVGTVGVHRVA